MNNMSERKVNLKEISNNIVATGALANPNYKRSILDAMKEACRQTLELAAENAECKLKNKIECDSSQLENGFVIGNNAIVINKQSILDTINQVE